jgi:hypothetical protein
VKIVTNENVKVGDKVVRGRDWNWANQDKGSVYGITIVSSDILIPGWVEVNWVNTNGEVIGNHCYQVGYSDKYDLYFYEGEEGGGLPTPKFKVGDKGKICERFGCNGSGWRFDGEYSKINRLGGQNVTIFHEPVWDEIKREWYYHYSNGQVAEHAITIIHKSKTEQNGTDKSVTTEVQRPIRTDSGPEGPTGVTVSGGRRGASIVSRPISNQTISGSSKGRPA